MTTICNMRRRMKQRQAMKEKIVSQSDSTVTNVEAEEKPQSSKTAKKQVKK